MQTHTRPGQGRQKQNPLFSRRCRRPAGKESGAALLIALAILMVLLSLAITFILIVRFESNIARQTFDRTRAEHLLDGAFAQAQYRLNRDLEVHPDAVSLDHGWRSWFSGAAFQEKYWARNPLGAPQVNIEPVESVLRGPLNGGVLYVRFRKDWHTEPLFRGPRTEHWLHVPRRQYNMILLFAPADEAELINNVGTLLLLDDLNNALVAAGRPERFERMTEDRIKAEPGLYPFRTPAFMNTNTAAPEVEGLLPQEVVNTWADVDSDGDGMRDAIWMPLARDINYHGDGIDNDLNGEPDPISGEASMFEPAAFVYSSAGLPEAARDEDPDTLRLIRGKFWNDPTRWEDGVFPQGDGLDNDGNGIVDDEGVRLFLTVPLPGLLTQVDVNGDGVFNEKDWYVDTANGFAGPLFMRLPDTLFVPITTGLNPDGSIATGREPVTIGNVDMLDNDADLMVNNFRAYAYVGKSDNDVKPGFHDIKLNAILETSPAANLSFFCVTQTGTTQSLPYTAVANYFGDINNTPPESQANFQWLRLACSGEPISEITGRYALNITDEAGKANLNAGGGYTNASPEAFMTARQSNPDLEYLLERATNDGISSFEYETRLLPKFGISRPRSLWGMRTGFDASSYDTAFEPEFNRDGGMPGYGFVDDNGNALLLSLSGRDFSGDGWIDGGLNVPRISLNYDTQDNISKYFINNEGLDTLFNDDTSPLGRIEFNQFLDSYLRLGRFQGIDEPGELQLFNPLRNAFAEAVLGEPGRYSDRLLLRKEFLQRVYLIAADTWDFLRNLVTVNSDMRNTYAARGHGLQQAFLRVDPNYATPQQLATALFVRGDTTTIVDRLVFKTAADYPVPPGYVGTALELNIRRFAEGLRQFDTAFTGDLMGYRRQLAGNDRYLPGMTFPADPVLQTLRLATEAAAARDRSQGRRKLVTENILSSLEAYQKYWAENTFGTGINLPLEALNERERIPARDIMPVGAVQEYLYSSLGLSAADARLITPDLWWKFFTQDPTTNFAGEDRLFQYATASLDAIRINELMVRPVRRVEAETAVYRYLDTNTPPVERIEQGIYERDATLQPAGYISNLDPAPYLGMPIFDMLRNTFYLVRDHYEADLLPDPYAVVNETMVLDVPSYWGLYSAYDLATNAQPLLGDRCAYVLETPVVGTVVSDNYMPALDIMEFEFRGAAQPDEVNSIDGLPEGRYYLTVNVTDQYGTMTVLDPDVLQYSIKYKKGDTHTGIAEDAATLYNVNDPYSINAVNALFQNVDQPEYLATPAARAKGSAAPAGWVFLPNTALDTDGFDYYMSPYYEDFNATINDFAAWPVREIPDPTDPTLEEYLIAYPDPDITDDIEITTSDPDGDSVPDIILGIDTAVNQVSWYNPLFQQALVDWFLTQGFPLPVDVGYPQTLIPITHLTELDDYRAWLDLNGIVYTLDPDVQLLYDALQTYEARFGIVRDYFSNDILKANYPASTNGRTFTVIVPRASSGYRLCVGLRFAAEPRGLFTQALEDWVLGYNAGTIDPSVDFPPPALTHAEYLAFYRVVADSGIVLPAGFSYPPPRLAVNFFDFSQEPDHEYLELVNTSDEEVDVGGWRLEVGVPGPVGVEQNSTIQDPYKSVWRIPGDTKVAAGGHLLLGFDQQDEYRRGDVDEDTESYLIATNGMGLAANETDDALDGITVPPMADESFRMNPVGTGRWYAPLNDGYPANETLGTGSVFQRNDGQDYIDNDGDGLSSAYYFRDPDGNVAAVVTNFVDNLLPDLPGFLEPSYTDTPADTYIRARYEALDTDRYYEDFKTHSEDGDTIPAWSRIVQLENEYLWLENGRFDPPLYPEKYDPIGSDTVSIRMQDIAGPQGLTRLARLVLRGGVLPNYPERDGIDNDGDGGYVIKNPGAGVTRFENPNASQTGAADFFTEPVLQYVPGTLDKDMIDNNLDYVLDERGNEIFNTDDGVFVRHGNPLLSEGVDEGRLGNLIYYVFDVDGDGNIVSGTDTIIPSGFQGFIVPFDSSSMSLPISLGLPRFYGHGSYEGTPLPLYHVWNGISSSYPTMYRENWIAPVFTLNGNPPYLYTLADGIYAIDGTGNLVSARPEDGFNPFITTGDYFGAVNPNSFPVITDTDSPDWQAFVERRWNPGDNVVVTLYVGHPDLNRVADQVTYRENDVINRTLDDIVPSPYAVDGFSNYGYTAVDGIDRLVWLAGSGTLDATDRVCLHPPALGGANDPGKPSFWLPDHMGLDFYRSLERKHPLYHGDRFGTANRWTVTDGAYDDWADSMSLFQSGLGAYYNNVFNLPGTVGFIDNASDIFGQELRLVYPRFVDLLDPDLTTLNVYERSARQLYGHAIWGSPLRMNSQARVWENPADLAGLTLGLGTLHLNHNYDRRPGRQFPGLDVYRNTGHKLIQRLADRNEAGLTNDSLERRSTVDWALRRAGVRKDPYTAPADLADLPFLSFERVLDGPYNYADTGGLYFPRYAVSPLNTRYFASENDVQNLMLDDVGVGNELRRMTATNNIHRFSYGYDPDLTGALASQVVPGGGMSVMRETLDQPDAPSIVAAAMDVSAMNPVVLTVGQARVVPLWPAPPDALNPATGSTFTEDDHRLFFKWQTNGPPHQWTPVYLMNLPMPSGGTYTAELPWLRVNYPRRMYASPNPPVVHSLAGTLDDPLVQPVYLFNGYYYAAQYFPAMAADIRGGQMDGVNQTLAQTLWPRWPVRVVASVIASDYEQRAPSDRAVMYVSKYSSELGEQNRPEALFVWDRDAGLENGTYVAYVGTFIPGLAERLAEADDLALDAQAAFDPAEQIPLVHNGSMTKHLLDLDPTRRQILSQSVPSAASPRFDPHLAFEFMTDRRDAEQMRDYGVARNVAAGVYGMAHPGEWGKEGDPGLDNVARGQVEAADKEGYLLYSAGSGIAWQPIPVRVTDNFLALRVRNTGSPSQVACVTHVVLAPAPRTKGVVNVNTTETHRAVVSGRSGGANWTVQLFNALMGVPGITNALNLDGNRNFPPYVDEDLGLPQMVIPKADYSNLDPWRQRWISLQENELLDALWGAAPYAYAPPPLVYDETPRDAFTDGSMPLVTGTVSNGDLDAWDGDLHGRVVLRMASLLAEGRAEHPDGRYYSSPSELLDGIGTGGIARADRLTGPWPLSNLGVTLDGFARNDHPTQKLELHEKRYDEILERFRRMNNMITTRSDVFEIIATVQSGSMSDLNQDGIYDYRGDEFFPQAERRARMIYDRRARAVRQDEKRQ